MGTGSFFSLSIQVVLLCVTWIPIWLLSIQRHYALIVHTDSYWCYNQFSHTHTHTHTNKMNTCTHAACLHTLHTRAPATHTHTHMCADTYTRILSPFKWIVTRKGQKVPGNEAANVSTNFLIFLQPDACKLHLSTLAQEIPITQLWYFPSQRHTLSDVKNMENKNQAVLTTKLKTLNS